jgi:hypothetical protein
MNGIAVFVVVPVDDEQAEYLPLSGREAAG